MLDQLKAYKKQKTLISRELGISEKNVQDAIEEIITMIKSSNNTITLSSMITMIQENSYSELKVYNESKLAALITMFDTYFEYVFSRDGNRYIFNIK